MPKKRKRAQKLLGSHQKCWLWGRHVVLETLRAGRWRVLELFLADRLDEASQREARELAERTGTPVAVEPFEKLSQRCHCEEHQGYVARMAPFPYWQPEELLQRCPSDALLVILDGVQDPQNLGTIVRSAAAFGAHGLFLRERGQVGVTAAVARASAGAVNWVPVARVPSPAELIGRLRARGVRVLATAAGARTQLFEEDLRQGVAFVFGNEARGLSEEVAQVCDATVAIPQCGAVESLNVAVSASVCLYEARRQRLSLAGPDR